MGNVKWHRSFEYKKRDPELKTATTWVVESRTGEHGTVWAERRLGETRRYILTYDEYVALWAEHYEATRSR